MRDYLGFFSGRVDAEASGNQMEQFINLVHRSRIPVSRLKRREDGVLLFTIPRRAFKRLRQPAFKTGTRIRIRKKRGIKVLLHPYRKRWGAAVGVLFFFAVIYFCSGFIWQVEVTGCVHSSAVQIMADLAELGLDIGAKRSVDVQMIENDYLTGNEKLSWMSINIRGTTAYVEVREKTRTPKVEDLTIPTNIYAARDGLLLSVRDYAGTRQVQAGEAVKAGDLLVSGDWTDKYGVRRLSHCIATVIAETRHDTSFSVPLEEHVRRKTGRKKKFFSISFGKFKIPLYFNKKISYNEYDTMMKEYPLHIGSFAFPIRIYRLRVEEVEIRPVRRTEAEAKERAQTLLAFYEKDALSGLPVRRREVQETVEADALHIHAVFYCEEEIGIEMPIEE